MKLDDLLALPKSGVVILVKNNQVLVTYTTSMGAHLESLYNQFKGHKGIALEVMSAGVDIETLKLHTEFYRDYYSDKKGLVLMQAHLRKTVDYRVRQVPSSDFKRVDVEIVTARGDSRVVGRFKTVKEAKEFIETYYGSDNKLCFPVYSFNADTKAFLLDNQKKMLDIR